MLIIKDLFYRIKDDELFSLSSQIAFSFLFSLFPFLIFLITLLSFIEVNEQDIFMVLSKLLPSEIYQLIQKVLQEVLYGRDIEFMSFGLVVAVWAASKGMRTVIKALNKAYDEEENRGYIRVQITSICSTVIIALVIAVTFIVLIFGEVNSIVLATYFEMETLIGSVEGIILYALVFVIMICIFLGIYLYSPCRRLKFKEVLPGSVFTTVAWVISSRLFSLYINNFSSYSLAYGSIGAMICIMTWLFCIACILLLGGELNACLALKK